jgi:AcrR family transcriptional regulator
MHVPRISEQQRESNRAHILQAALTCFSRDGFHHTTTADIVRESGVSQGTLYLYFKSKDDLIAALADDRHQQEAALNALAADQGDPKRSLLHLIALYSQRLADPNEIELLRVGLQGWAEALRNKRVSASVLEGVVRARAALVRILRRGQKAGVFRHDIQAAAMARLLVALFQGFLLQTVWEPKADLRPCFRLARQMLEEFLAGRLSNAK